MVFQTKAVQSLLARQVKAVSSKASSRSLSAIPIPSSSSESSEPRAAVGGAVSIDDSFAFYPIQKNRIVTTSSNPTQSAKECFSYYPSTGVTERKITLREATAAYSSKKPSIQTKEDSTNNKEILKDPIIQQRLMELKNQKTTTTTDSSTTTSSVTFTESDDSFAYYPVQNHRSIIQTTPTSVEGRECFSFYYPSSSSNASSSFKTAGRSTTTGATLEGEKATMLTPDKMKEIHYDETDSSFSAIIEKKGISFETATPSPTSRSVTSSSSSSSTNTTGTTNWENVVMHALNKASSTTVVLP